MSMDRCRYGRHPHDASISYTTKLPHTVKSFLEQLKQSFSELRTKQNEVLVLDKLVLNFFHQSLRLVAPNSPLSTLLNPSMSVSVHSDSSSPVSAASSAHSYSSSSSSSSSSLSSSSLTNDAVSPSSQFVYTDSSISKGVATLSQLSSLIKSTENTQNGMFSFQKYII